MLSYLKNVRSDAKFISHYMCWSEGRHVVIHGRFTEMVNYEKDTNQVTFTRTVQMWTGILIIFWRVLTMVWCIFEESCFMTLSIVQCFSLKITFRKPALLPSSGKKGGRGGTYSMGSIEKVPHFTPLFYLKTVAEPVSETLFLKKNTGRWIKS
jgi:hypothetical protein